MPSYSPKIAEEYNGGVAGLTTHSSVASLHRIVNFPAPVVLSLTFKAGRNGTFAATGEF
jgi:hypothetical protein